ncbi:MAG TPA: HypC/HybG/HupF family hydrogenase formation chaperone [Patescibacteria group bacterium]|nr:HypC/HybG/HupF family hydrogenase formation chaperone [Patescibacteria group bacterium]
MCLTIPQKVKNVSGNQAELSDGRHVSLVLVTGVQAGDWVLTNNEIVVNKISAIEADEILQLTQQGEKQ